MFKYFSGTIISMYANKLSEKWQKFEHSKILNLKNRAAFS